MTKCLVPLFVHSVHCLQQNAMIISACRVPHSSDKITVIKLTTISIKMSPIKFTTTELPLPDDRLSRDSQQI